MKSIDEILLETHGDRDFNYKDIKAAFGIFAKQKNQAFHNLLFKGEQLKIWCALNEYCQSTKTLSKATGIPSKNISTQIKNMIKATDLIIQHNNGRLKYWQKRETQSI